MLQVPRKRVWRDFSWGAQVDGLIARVEAAGEEIAAGWRRGERVDVGDVKKNVYV